MARSNDAAVLLALVRLAEQQAGDTPLIRAGMRLADRLGGRPRDDRPIHTQGAAAARARKMAGIPAGSMSGGY